MRTCTIPWLQTFAREAIGGFEGSEQFFLAAGEIRRVEASRGGISIHCKKGCVWVTQEGDPRDLILNGGDNRKTAGRGLVIIESLESAEVRIL